MARVSKIRRLPKEMRELINGWFDDGLTIVEVTEKINELNREFEISRSAVGRKRKKWAEITARVRVSREIAETFVRNFKDEPASQIAQANIEALQTLFMNYIEYLHDGEISKLKPDDFMKLGIAAHKLGGARKAEVDTTITAEEAAKASAEEAGQGEGTTLEVVFKQPAAKAKAKTKSKAKKATDKAKADK